MRRLASRHLRAPLLVGGAGFALAVGVLVVGRWAAAVPVAVVAALSTGVSYWLSRSDSDVGALFAGSPDERQAAVGLWVRAFAALCLLVLAVVGAIVSAVAGRTAWPYLLIVGLGGVCFFVAAALYRRSGRVTASSTVPSVRLDERQVAVVLCALESAGILMFVVATIAGIALSGKGGSVAFRIQAVAFGVAIVTGFVVFRPRTKGES